MSFAVNIYQVYDKLFISQNFLVKEVFHQGEWESCEGALSSSRQTNKLLMYLIYI